MKQLMEININGFWLFMSFLKCVKQGINGYWIQYGGVLYHTADLTIQFDNKKSMDS